MKFTGMRLSDPRVKDVLLSDVTDADYLYFVDDETGVTFRIRIGVLRAAIGGGGGGVSDATRRLSDADGVVDAGKRLFSTLPTDYGRDIWIEPGVAAEQRWLQLPGNAALGTVLRVRYGGTLENGETTLRFGGNSDADGLNLLITPSGVYSGLREGYVLTLVHAERIEDDGEWLHAWWVLSETHVPVPANLAEVLDDLEAAVDAVEATANNALPKPGGTTTANGIVTGSGTTGDAVAVSTTTIADLVKRLGNVFTLNANAVLDDSYSGSVIFVDTSGGARTLTIPPTLGAGWNAVVVREGANTLNIVGSTVGADTMLMKGPAAAANAVAIAVDDGGVSVLKRSATKCWCAGKVS